MATYFHNAVSLDGFFFEDSQFTVKLASGITSADVNKALSQDGTNANQFKLAADGDVVEGMLILVEDRKTEGFLIGTMARRFGAKLPVKAADALAVGDRIIGAGAGEIRKALASAGGDKQDYRWSVVEVASSKATIMSS
jgi:hypothetical protein